MNPESKQKRIAFGYMRLANNQIAIHEGQSRCSISFVRVVLCAIDGASRAAFPIDLT